MHAAKVVGRWFYTGKTEEEKDASCCAACRNHFACEFWVRSTTKTDCWLKAGFKQEIKAANRRGNFISCARNGAPECADVVPPFQVGDGGDWVGVPDHEKGLNGWGNWHAEAKFYYKCDAPTTLQFKVLAHMPHGASNSLYVSNDEMPRSERIYWTDITGAKSKWLAFPHTFEVSEGNHVLHFMNREDGTLIHRVELVGDVCYFVNWEKVTEEPTLATMEPTEATEEPTEATAEPSEATQEPTEATEEPTEVTMEPTEATMEPSEATEEPSEATEEPTEATEEPTEATEEPTEATMEPTEATAEPTEITIESTAAQEFAEATEGTTETPEDYTVEFQASGNGCKQDLHCVWAKQWPYNYKKNLACSVTFEEDAHLHWSKHFLLRGGASLVVAGQPVTKWDNTVPEVHAGDTLTFTTNGDKSTGAGFMVCLEDPAKPELNMVSNFHYEQKILSPDNEPTFGTSLCLDWDSLAIGARQKAGPNGEAKVGAVYFYDRNTETNVWEYSSVMQPPQANPELEFGFSVSRHGDWMAVGARGGAGRVYIYEKDSNGGWQLNAEIKDSAELKLSPVENFGASVSVDYPWVAVGSLAHNKRPRSGRVRIFHHENGEWKLTSTIKSPVDEKNYWFGWSLAIHHEWMFVGAPGVSTPGFVHIYQMNENEEWVFLEKIFQLDVGTNQRFGISVSIDEEKALVGCSLVDKGRGATYFYHLVDGHWVFQETELSGHWSFDMKEVEDDTMDKSQYGQASSISHGHMVVAAKGRVYEYSLHDQEVPHMETLTDDSEEHEYGPGVEDEVELDLFVDSPVWTLKKIGMYAFTSVGALVFLYVGLTAGFRAVVKPRYAPIHTSSDATYGATL